eukprot:TRINITY_DN660_c0_g1_i6.p1 TRINITY_DN660_c0_g1~~TRINITY_DN660_c0_g1_i6.p1  ORF type:complete len:223 (+),score=129.12 TRINITY_DN660_c0_g1_i6:53-721(+)
MSNPKCANCNKTAYPLESVTALDKAYHKGCFKCSVCNTILNLKNFKGVDGKIYCATHTPKPSSTAVADSLAVKQALNAPKKTAEGLSKVSKTDVKAIGTGLDSVTTANALKAPKKVAEGARGVQKGTGGKPQYAVFGADGTTPVEGEAAAEHTYSEEQPAEEQQQYEEQPAEEQQYEEQQYEEQPAEEQQYEEQPAEEQQYEEGQYEEQQYEEQPAEEEQQW